MRLKGHIEGFIFLRQSTGQRYLTQAGELRAFGKYLGDVPIEAIVSDDILAFLNERERSRHTWRRKYSQLQRLFRYCHAVGGVPLVDMPLPRGLARTKFAPRIFSRAEIKRLLTEADRRKHATNGTISRQSFRMVLLLLYATGGRFREVIALRRCDVNLREATVLFGAGTSEERNLPIGPELAACLKAYSNLSQQQDGSAPLIERKNGGALSVSSVRRQFKSLCKLTGVGRRDSSDPWQPRLLDLRATFAVHRIGQIIEQGEDLNRLLPALAHYLGYRDLLAAEKFLQLAPERFATALKRLSPEERKGCV